MTWERRIATAGALSLLLFCSPSAAGIGERSPDGVWVEVAKAPPLRPGLRQVPAAARVFEVDEPAIRELLRSAPMESDTAAKRSQLTITLPMPDGGYQRFRVVESPVLAPHLEARFPDASSYRVRGIDEPSAAGRIGWTSRGLHGLVFTASGAVYIGGYEWDVVTRYFSGYLGDYTADVNCGVEWASSPPGGGDRNSGGGAAGEPNKDLQGNPPDPPDPPDPPEPPECVEPPDPEVWRNYRLAIAASYSFCSQPALNHSSDAVNSIALEMVDDVNAVYERDLRTRFTLVDVIDYCGLQNDPFDDFSSGSLTLFQQNNLVLGLGVGSSNYDIGHLFAYPAGEPSYGAGTPCDEGRKGNGFTRFNGDPAAGLLTLMHEMGHQWGAQHTFSSDDCIGSGTGFIIGVEPGSGSTIMSYAGNCSPALQAQSDAYYHTRSIIQMECRMENEEESSCYTTEPLNDDLPVVSTGITSAKIPPRTPFALSGSAVDGDVDSDPGQELTYIWEQNDPLPYPIPPLPLRALFRSYEPSPDESTDGNNPSGRFRMFPALDHILTGTSAPGETLPSEPREMNFLFTVRDGAGGRDWTEVTLEVLGEDPFRILYPSPRVAVPAGPVQVQWQHETSPLIAVGGVNVFLSTDRARTFELLAEDVSNSGIADVDFQVEQTTHGAVVKVEPRGEYPDDELAFFAMSELFSIYAQCPQTTDCTEGCVESNCQQFDTGNAECWDDGVQFCSIPAGSPETVVVTVCDCVIPPGVRTGSCAGQSESWDWSLGCE